MIEEGEAEDVIGTWTDILQDIPPDIAMTATRRLCRIKADFAPTPGEIYQACIERSTELTVYQIQQQEHEQRMLELKEYHETEQVGPPPEHVRQKLDAIFKKVRVTEDES